MSEDKWEALDARVGRLEKQNRWLRIGCWISSLAFVSVLTMGQARIGRTVEAQSFVLKSAKGEVRAELTTLDGDYPRLSLRSPNGEKEVQVSPLGFSVLDHGISHTPLPLAHYGNSGLYFMDAQGHTILELGGASTERPQLTAAPEMKIFDGGSQVWHAP